MPYKLTIPLEPHTASRPNWATKGRHATRTYMPEGYRKFRHAFKRWFDDYLMTHHNDLMYFLTHLKDGRAIRHHSVHEGREGDLLEDFYGYSFKIVFVISRTKNEERVFPIATRTADIDNYTKAITDGIFESDAAKYFKLNDRWIQHLDCYKRYTWLDSDEQGHIEIEISRMENVEGIYS